MANGDGDALSSSSISSPPVSPQNQDTIHVSRLPPSTSNFSSEGGVVHPASGTPARANNAANTNATATSANATANATAPKKPKAPRKKKEVPLGPDGKPLVEEKPKKPRKPREPKDKAATAAAAANKPTTAAAPRKKLKTEHKVEDVPVIPQDATTQARQPTITEMVGAFQQQAQVSSATPISTPTPAPAQPHTTPQHRNSDGVIRSTLPIPPSNPPTPRPVSSGQNYDPIRGQNYDPIRGSTIGARSSDGKCQTFLVSSHFQAGRVGFLMVH